MAHQLKRRTPTWITGDRSPALLHQQTTEPSPLNSHAEKINLMGSLRVAHHGDVPVFGDYTKSCRSATVTYLGFVESRIFQNPIHHPMTKPIYSLIGGIRTSRCLPILPALALLLSAFAVHRAEALTPLVKIPTLSPHEAVVSMATPQDYGAVADGVTDCTAAFQSAMDAVYGTGQRAGGVVYVPAGNYAFYGNIKIPTGVTLHGDWKDWTTGTGGAVGTIFKVYTTGPATGTPFLTMACPSGLKGVTIWYPNQSATNIQPYPFTITVPPDCTVQNVILVNSYQGITAPGARHHLSTVIGSPLAVGLFVDGPGDIPHTEDIRFSPGVWSASGLPGAPAVNGPHASWMRANGIGMWLTHTDGEINNKTYISGYLVGIRALAGTRGKPGASFYQGAVTDCGTALQDGETPGQSGLQFSWFTLDGDVAIDPLKISQPNLKLHSCTIIGRSGVAIRRRGGDWKGWTLLNNCNITGTIEHSASVINLVNCVLNAPVHCTMAGDSVYAGFTGCTFLPSRNIVNNAAANRLNVEDRTAIVNQLPMRDWSTVTANYQTRKPAKTDLFVATSSPYNAAGNGIADDTAAIQSALNAAGANGGGIVYLPGGHYKTTGTLTVPSGVELRGVWETRHNFVVGLDGKTKGSRIQPYGGQGNAAGPVAVALSANSGIVGVDFVYETQSATAPIAFPPTIQGRGSNVYAIAVSTPNSYYFADLITYTCTNHFLYMINGCILKTGIKAGNGSSGTLANIQNISSFWSFLRDSASTWNDYVNRYTEDNLELFVFGNANVTIWKGFGIFAKTLLRTNTEAGKGPVITGVGVSCDASYQGFQFSGAGSTTVNIVNPGMAISSGSDEYSAAVVSTSTFQGTARLFNAALFSNPVVDFNIGGGDVGVELVQMLSHSPLGSKVTGGVFRIINQASYVVTGPTPYLVNKIEFGPGAGLPGKVSEVIGGYCDKGFNVINNSLNNPINVWGNYSHYYKTVLAGPEVSNDSTSEALDRPVMASTTAAGAGISAEAVNDGDSATSWESAPADGEWIYVDLQSRKNINNVALNWNAAYGKGFKIQVSDNATSWTDAYTTTTGTGGNQLISINAAGRYVRMLGTQRGTAGGYSLKEFGVYSNLARGRPVVSSGTAVMTPPVFVAYVTDADTSTRWSSNSTDNEWIYVDLQSVRQISSIVLDWHTAYGRSYKLQISNNATTWTDAYSTTDGVGGVESIPVSASARYVRMLGITRGTSAGYSLFEFGVY